MPPRNERVATMVRTDLGKDPSLTNDVLMERAKTMDPSLRRMTPRQFHATYRLPALRAAKAAAGPAPSPAAAPSTAAAAPAASSSTPAAPAVPKRRGRPPASAKLAQAPVAAAAPTAAPSTPAPAPAPSAPSAAPAKSHSAEQAQIRQILHQVVQEALKADDRASFVQLFNSLDERAGVIHGMFHKS